MSFGLWCRDSHRFVHTMNKMIGSDPFVKTMTFLGIDVGPCCFVDVVVDLFCFLLITMNHFVYHKQNHNIRQSSCTYYSVI